MGFDGGVQICIKTQEVVGEGGPDMNYMSGY